MGQQPRIINVAGNFIAEQHIGTYIAHAEHVHTNQPDAHPRIAEDVTFEEVQNQFRYITPACRKAGMVEHVENHLRTACTGSAEALWKCIHEYEMMDYLGTQVIDASTLYDEICAYFGALPYDKRNFRKYR